MRVRGMLALGAALLLLLATLSGCCCDAGPDRLVRVEITDTQGQREHLRWNAPAIPFPTNAYFTVYFYSKPGADKLRTVPMLELYESDGVTRIALQRFLGNNDGGCADAEIYEPRAEDLVIGDTYVLVHKQSAAPGDFEDTGDFEGDERHNVTTFGGEPALVARIIAATQTQGSGGGGGGGGIGGGFGGGGGGGGVGGGGGG
jgi:uncharacterized membrane protein YgcG